MSRSKALFRPSLALAMGGLLLLGPMTGQAQDKPPGEERRMMIPPPERADGFENSQPFPWPAFLDVRPAPGRYHSRLKIVEFAMDGGSPLDDAEVEAIMRESMTNEQTYCIRGDEPLEDWAEEIGAGTCDPMSLQREGDDFTMQMVCRHLDGAVMELDASGTVTPTASRMLIGVTGVNSEFGSLDMRFISLTNRLGDCE